MSTENEAHKHIFWSEGFVLGFITLFGYVLAFIYEYAYSSSYFGIPIHFIDIRLVNIFVASFAIAGFCFFARNIFEIIETIGLIEDTAIGRFRAKHVFVLLFSIPPIYVQFQNEGWLGLSIVLCYVIFIFAIEIIGTLSYGKGESLWSDKRKKLEEAWSKESGIKNSSVVTNRLFGRLSYYDYIPRNIIFSSVILCVLAFNLGNYTAYSKTKFYTLSSDREQVVIAQYGNTIFTVPVDRNTNVFTSNLKIINIDDLSVNKITLVYEIVGQLKKPEILISSSYNP